MFKAKLKVFAIVCLIQSLQLSLGQRRKCNSSTEFDCGIIGECIDSLKRCNGRTDCSNGRDEFQCDSLNGCSMQQFRCNNGQCAPKSYLCDHVEDCLDGSDESKQFCPNSESPSCYDNEFLCLSGECISKSERCNHIKDCSDGSDEKNCNSFTRCTNNEFQCDSDGECINAEDVCDGKNNCDDGSDERRCTGKSPVVTDNTYQSTTPRSFLEMRNISLRQPPQVKEWIANGQVYYPQPKPVSNTMREPFSLLALHMQSLSTIQRMAYSVGILAESIRSVTYGRNPYYWSHDNLRNPVYSTARKPSLLIRHILSTTQKPPSSNTTKK